MARNRFFVEKIESEVSLSGEEFRHARKVLRLALGSEATLFDGSGEEYSAIVSSLSKDGMVLHVTGKSDSERDPKTKVLLLMGALKGDKTELVVQKASELGAEKVVVFSSKYSSSYFNENKLERLSRVSREASKQCMRNTILTVEYRPSLKEALLLAEGYENKLFACEFIKESERDFSALKGSCALVVGSEGGFSEEEFLLAKELGFFGVSLGKRILRAETAAIALLSVVMDRLGELS